MLQNLPTIKMPLMVSVLPDVLGDSSLWLDCWSPLGLWMKHWRRGATARVAPPQASKGRWNPPSAYKADPNAGPGLGNSKIEIVYKSKGKPQFMSIGHCPKSFFSYSMCLNKWDRGKLFLCALNMNFQLLFSQMVEINLLCPEPKVYPWNVITKAEKRQLWTLSRSYYVCLVY